MGEEEGADVPEAYMDEDGETCIDYDGSVLGEEQAVAKHGSDDYTKQS